ncbi:zinc-ribbon domain-containing protein [Curtobacterium sp. MCPF17_051]|uniref:zinc-ribbon domain-containing protein n=1 Tax=Curtobacterium sp. MCPF17_051 TaxID=2175640 RepID=UPI0015E8A2D3|nr:zinc-ribbon domain-containing protein [Curtobacterium sp. MCPF17_051]
MTNVVGFGAPSLVDGLWCLLRPMFFFRREQAWGSPNDDDWDVHLGPMPNTILRIEGPVQPFDRFNQQLRTCCANRWTQFVWTTWSPHDEPWLRSEVRSGRNSALSFICQAGHRFRTPANALNLSHRNRFQGCGFCARHRVAPGLTSLDVTHPLVAARWHPSLNDAILPAQILAGSPEKHWWLCGKGHEYVATVGSQTGLHPRGCPYCAGTRVDPGVTGIDPARPDMLAIWDHKRNPELPKNVSPGVAKQFWWTCPRGHSYQATAINVSHGRRCGICAGKQVVAGVNDFASRRPDLLAEWNAVRNSVQPNEVPEFSNQRVWWRCERGHEWQAPIVARSSDRRGCPVCSGRRLRAGTNTFADLYPHLASQWDPLLNGGVLPTDVGRSSRLSVWWRCDAGHAFRRTVAERILKPNCGYCTCKWVLPGVNDVLTRYPVIAADWEVERNRPAIACLPGTARRYWLCVNGHRQHETVPNRVKTDGCPRCPKEERAAYYQTHSASGSAPFLRIIEALQSIEDRQRGGTERGGTRTGYPEPMSRLPRATPAELAPEPWPEAPSDDPVAEAVRRFVVRLQREIGDRSVRSVASIANVDHGALLRVLAGKTWPDLATLARLEIALRADLWGRAND